MTAKRNKLVLTVITAMLGLSLTGCGGAAKPAETKAGDASAAGSKPVKLRITWWGAQSRHDATLKILDLYTKKNPNITFEPEYSGWDGYIDKLTTQAAAKNAPDIMQMDAAWLADWNARGQLADLSSVNVKDVDAGLLAEGKYKDKQTTVPLGKNAWGLVYDKSALEKLGFQLKNDITWDEFFQLVKDIKSKVGKDQYVMMDGTNNRGLYSSYQLSKGKGHPITMDGKFNWDRDTWLEWVKIFDDFRKQGIVPPADIAVSDKELDPKLDLMVTGKVIFRAAHAAQASSWDSLKPGSIGVAAIPKGQQGGGWLKSTFFFGVSQDSKNKEEAKKFIEWFINDPEVAEIAGTTRGIPVSNKIVSSLQPKFTAADKLTVEMIEKAKAGAQQFNPGAKGWNNFETKDFKAISEALMFGKSTADQSFEDLKKKAKEYEK